MGRCFGPSVLGSSGGLAEQAVEVGVLALSYGAQNCELMIPPEPVRTTFVPCRSALARRLKWSRAFSPTLLKHCQPATDLVLHDNGIWLPTNHAAARVARQTGAPRIVSTRGMLTKWAFQYRGQKKRLAWWLYQRRDLQQAKVLHATSHQEAAEFRELKLTQPIAVVPNGVTLPPPHQPADSPIHRFTEPAYHRTPDAPTHRRTVLFLGRIHPIKGLLNLVEAWAEVKRSGVGGQRSMWQVVIAGQDENGHKAEVEAAIRERQLQQDFRFVGAIDGPAKWDVYRSANLFVLPSHTENFGLVVAEALACGLPVITTRGTPWEELVTRGCGWWTQIGAEPLARALREATTLTDAERQEMGRRGRRLVADNYTWPAAAQKMLAVYRWMLGQGERPGCVSVIR